MTEIEKLSNSLKSKCLKLVTAESCTGGLIAKKCTDLPGSSVWFECGFVTYSNEAKVRMLAVDEGLINQNGAVSKLVAESMVLGALKHSGSDIAVAVTGIAGPDGGSKEKPVGTVWIAWAIEDQLISQCYIFEGDREQVREKTATVAINGLMLMMDSINNK